MGIVKYEDLSDKEKKEHDDIFEKMREKEELWFESRGYTRSIVIAAGLEYQSFLEKEKRDKPNNLYIYTSPLARKMFMIGWLRNSK